MIWLCEFTTQHVVGLMFLALGGSLSKAAALAKAVEEVFPSGQWIFFFPSIATWTTRLVFSYIAACILVARLANKPLDTASSIAKFFVPSEPGSDKRSSESK